VAQRVLPLQPNVGCDAGGQETRCELSPDGEHYILNGEKKWATSGALSQIFTVMAKQKMADGKEKVTALVCTPDMPGIDIFQRNRSKCGIRGTWQARIRFNHVKVPRSHLLGTEGKGLNIALTCLNYGRCTLSAGMLGGARFAMEQAIKWSQTRFQFQRPLADFELVQQKIARMSAMVYAMDAVLYMTTGMLDRHDEDIMLETAICKIFCSEMGWRVVNDAMQIMGGESYMTENQIERIFRDSRINLIVEGANEVMQSFIFAYGGKQLAEHMLGVQQALAWDGDVSLGENFSRIAKNLSRASVVKAAMPLAAELFLGMRPRCPTFPRVDSSLRQPARRFCNLVSDLSHQFKLASKRFGEKIVSKQATQARLADAAMWLHAWACTLSKLDRDIRSGGSGLQFNRDRSAATHFFDIAEHEIHRCFRELFNNVDESMTPAAEAAMKYAATLLPNEDYVIPEASPNAKGSGRKLSQDGIKQFGTATPSLGTPGEGRGEGSASDARSPQDHAEPSPNPLPEYRERGNVQTPRARAG